MAVDLYHHTIIYIAMEVTTAPPLDSWACRVGYAVLLAYGVIDIFDAV